MSDFDNTGNPCNVIPPWRVPEPPPAVEEAEVVNKPTPEVVESPTTAEKPPEGYSSSVSPSGIPSTSPSTHKHRAVRGSGDPIYLIVDGKKHWVLNGETYKKLGYSFGEEEKIEQSELATFPPGKPITQENWEEFK
jgi:hypothetical protein